MLFVFSFFFFYHGKLFLVKTKSLLLGSGEQDSELNLLNS